MRYARLRAPRVACALLASALLLGACSDATTAPDDAEAARNQSRGGPVARVEVVSSDGSAAPASLAVGTTVKLGVRTWNAANEEVSGRKVVWSVGTTTTASINNSGTLAAKANGPVQVLAAVEGVVATHNMSVGAVTTNPGGTTPIGPVLTPLPPSSPTSVTAAVVRFDGGSGQTVASSGVPLMPGALRAGQEGFVHVFVGGVEQPAHVAALSGTHADGSLRAVLVQVRATLATGQTLPARVEITTTARSATNTLTSRLAAAAAVPAAALLPADPVYLVSTDIVGATTTAAAASSLGGAFAKTETDFAQWSDYHWNLTSDAWGENYYDRALIYFAQWARTGNPTYWYRGARQALSYRRDYLEANNYGASPHWAQLEGLEKHYLLTGDDASRYAVAMTADVIWRVWAYGFTQNNDYADARIYGRVVLGQLLALRLAGHPSAEISSFGNVAPSYSARLDFLISTAARWQTPDGAAAGRWNSGPLFCGGQYNFMAGILHNALVKTHTYYASPMQQATIVTLVRRGVEYMWNTQWTAGQGFNYGDIPNCDSGGAYPAPDLTGLIVAPFSWLAKQTGNAAFRTNGDAVYAQSNAGAALHGSKQFNQAYSSSWQYLGYR
jgi:hypothetical protein